MVASLFVCNDDDEFGDFTARHPFIELGHDLFDVRFDLIVARDCLKVRPSLLSNNNPWKRVERG